MNDTGFVDNVYNYISSEYGNSILKTVRSTNNSNTVEKIVSSSVKQNDTVEHTANKIIAMLRVNPWFFTLN